MRQAFLIILVVQLLWLMWGGSFNTMHQAGDIGDRGYFLATFPGAAIVDYITLRLLFDIDWNRQNVRYMQYLVCFVGTSVFTHLLGAYGYLAGNASALELYDVVGTILLLAEIGVLLSYGMGIFNRAIHNTNIGG